MMKLILHPYTLLLKQPFRIAHGSRTQQETLIVELRKGELSGFGEAVASPYYQISTSQSSSDLRKVNLLLEHVACTTPDELWTLCYPELKHNLFALCGLNNAAWDLYARQQAKPLYQLLGLKAEQNPLCNYTIGIASIPEMIEKIRAKPWPVYKIKLGTDHDLEIIQALRKYTDSPFRVDANCGWTAEEAIRYAEAFKHLGVELIEQPLPAKQLEEMREVYQYSSIPLIADESCMGEEDVDKCVGYFHGINIKLTKCGGISPARRMIRNARNLGMKVMMGCMTESSVGVSAIAHLAPLLDYVDMDSILLIANDPARGVTLESGKIQYSAINGIGVELSAKYI